MSDSNENEWVIGKYRVSEENVRKAISNGLTKLDVQVRLEEKRYSVLRAVSQPKRKMKERKTYTYVCNECVITFQVFSTDWLARCFCPSCGEYFDVEKYISVNKQKTNKKVRIPWKKEEEELIEKIFKGELSTHQVAMMLGRPINTIRSKMSRMRKGAKP